MTNTKNHQLKLEIIERGLKDADWRRQSRRDERLSRQGRAAGNHRTLAEG